MLRKTLLIAATIAFALGGAAAIFVGGALRGDPVVTEDIDRHFAQVDGSARASLETAAPPGVDREADEEEPFLLRGKSHFASRKFARAVGEGAVGVRRARGDSRSTRAFGPALESPDDAQWEGIRRIDSATYTIDEALFERARNSPRDFIGGARAAAAKEGGEPVGFRLKGLRRDDAISALGLENGDVITAINGHSLKNKNEVLVAAASLRFSDKFRLDVVRDGRTLSLYYRVEK